MRRIIAAIAVALVLVTTLAQRPAEAAWNPFPYGQCTWWAANMRPDLIGSVWGNAWHWVYEARWSGWKEGYNAERGAVVVFQPGAAGAGWYGHVAYVTAVGNNGWFQISEMNFPWWGSVSYRWVHTGWGISFIYW